MMGTSSLSPSDKTGQIVEIEAVTVPGLIYKPWVKRHENFGQKYNENDDILLIKTATKMEPKLKGNEFVINSICLPEPEMYLEHKSEKPLGRAYVAGWGLTDNRSSTLQEVEVPLISNEMANKILKESRYYFGSEGLYFIYNFTLGKKDIGTMANVPLGTGVIPPGAFNGLF